MSSTRKQRALYRAAVKLMIETCRSLSKVNFAFIYDTYAELYTEDGAKFILEDALKQLFAKDPATFEWANALKDSVVEGDALPLQFHKADLVYLLKIECAGVEGKDFDITGPKILVTEAMYATLTKTLLDTLELEEEEDSNLGDSSNLHSIVELGCF